MNRFTFNLLLTCCYFTAVVADSKDDPGCPTGYSSNDTKICYKIYSGPLSKSDAVKKCIADGAGLSRVIDDKANSYIQSLIVNKKIKLLWLGIDCENNSTDCTFEELGTVNYTNFYEDNPSPVGSCVYMSGRSATAGKWFLFDCAQAFPYVCEVEYGKQCPTGYKKYRNNCYRFVEEPATHIDADLACRKDCGKLASVRSEAEASFVSSLSINVTHQFRLIRVDNSTTAHLKGTEDSQVGKCYGMSIKDGLVKQGRWSSVNCEIKIPFICQTGFKSIKSPCPENAVLTYTPVDCVSQRLKGAGIVYSPGWPASVTYDGPTECVYWIVTPPGTVAEVSFPVLAIPESTSIKLYNDNSAAEPMAEIYSTSSYPLSLNYKSTLNQMVVVVSNNKTVSTSNKSFKNQWQMNYKPTDNIVLCPTNFTLYDGMCYGVVEAASAISQSAAELICKKYPGGSLVAIKNEEINEFLKSLLNKTTDNYMIGFLCSSYENCNWSDGKTSTTFTKWVDQNTNNYYRQYSYCTVWNNGIWTRRVENNCYEKKLICQSVPLRN